MAAETKKPRRQRRSFTDEFKAGAVKLVIDQGNTIAEVARDLDLIPSALSNWVEQARANAGKSERGTLTTDEKAELARLRRRTASCGSSVNPKKSGGLLREGERVKFSFIPAERTEPTPVGTVSELCDALGVCARASTLGVLVRRAHERGKTGSSR